MRNIKLIVEYDGTRFAGWQRQPDQRTVQGVLEESLQLLTGQTVTAHGAGRTDAGVHAEGQVVSFVTESRIPTDRFARALNQQLPSDVIVRSSDEADPSFHARYSAIGRIYRYRILSCPMPSALRRFHVWHIHHRLDETAMHCASALLIGEHDFRSFSAGLDDGPTTRDLQRIDILRQDDEWHLVFEANAFLRRMVRMLVGTLVAIGRGRWPVERAAQILACQNNREAGPAAPSHGLCLMHVRYNSDVSSK